METKKFIQDKQKSINWQVTLKVFIIGAIAIALLVPKFMILDLDLKAIFCRQTIKLKTTGLLPAGKY